MKDEDFADEELTPAQADPYLCEAALEVEGNEEVKMSKRALHRALYGFNRRSGGKKHKPKAKAKSIGKRPVAGAVGGKKIRCSSSSSTVACCCSCCVLLSQANAS